MKRPAIAMLVLLACGGEEGGPVGDDDDDDDVAGDDALSGARSGERLRMRIGTSADGARAFLGWYDEQLDTPCQIGVAPDGALRCLPEARVLTGDASTYYADAGCTEPLGRLACGEAPAFVAVADCVTPTAYYRTGAAFTGQAYQRGGGGACTELTQSFLLYRLDEMSPSDFAAIEETIE